MAKYAQGYYTIKNKAKYIGNGSPIYRSSWEFAFMHFCDNDPAVLQWASEAIKIPYRNPFTGKNTVYIPDFLIVYIDANNTKHAEIIEVKPVNETTMEAARTMKDKAYVILNMAKWEAARNFAKMNNMKFKIISDNDIFHKGSKKR